jgi:SAM-dependent methyltransferase
MTKTPLSLAPLPPNARMRWAIASPAVELLAPTSILEIGCGQGAFGARLASGSANYLAVEPDPASFAVARSRIAAAGGEIIHGTDAAVPMDRRFDLVCAFEVLEHLEDDIAALLEWREHLSDRGSLMVSVPAFQERFNQWDSHVGHYRRYSPEDMNLVMEKAGLKVSQIVVYGWPLGYLLEKVRGFVASRNSTAANGPFDPEDMRARTAGSGRILQPKAFAGKVLSSATVPFTWLQRARPDAGTGLVAIAHR